VWSVKESSRNLYINTLETWRGKNTRTEVLDLCRYVSCIQRNNVIWKADILSKQEETKGVHNIKLRSHISKDVYLCIGWNQMQKVPCVSSPSWEKIVLYIRLCRNCPLFYTFPSHTQSDALQSHRLVLTLSRTFKRFHLYHTQQRSRYYCVCVQTEGNVECIALTEWIKTRWGVSRNV